MRSLYTHDYYNITFICSGAIYLNLDSEGRRMNKILARALLIALVVGALIFDWIPLLFPSYEWYPPCGIITGMVVMTSIFIFITSTLGKPK